MAKRKVSLKWLQTSKDPTAIEFRRIVGESTNDCALCCMFLEMDYTDEDDNTSTCHFEEIDESELEHFQQLADFCVEEIEIVSLEGKTELPKEKVEFT
jgi:hypothetical protein